PRGPGRESAGNHRHGGGTATVCSSPATQRLPMGMKSPPSQRSVSTPEAPYSSYVLIGYRLSATDPSDEPSGAGVSNPASCRLGPTGHLIIIAPGPLVPHGRRALSFLCERERGGSHAPDFCLRPTCGAAARNTRQAAGDRIPRERSPRPSRADERNGDDPIVR